MDIEDHPHEHHKGTVPPHSLSSTFVNRSSCASVPAASQGATSANGLYDPHSVNAPSSSGISLESRTSPGGSPLMFRDDSLSNAAGFTECRPFTAGIPAWNCQPLPRGPPLSSASRSRSQTNPSFFPSTPCTQSYLASHEPVFQMTPGNLDPSVSLVRRALPSAFPVHPQPAQFASGALHTPYSSFPGQYIMSAHAPPFQNQLSQLHVYRGYHPLEPIPYPPAQNFRLPRHQPLPYFQHQSNVEDGNPSFQQTQHFVPPRPQSVTSSPGLSHTGSYSGTQRYPPHLYSSVGHFGLHQHHQHGVYQWYNGPASPPAHYLMNYSHRRTQPPRRDSNTLTAQSRSPECLPLPLGPNSSSSAVTTSRNTTSPTPGDPPEHISLQSSQKTDTHPSNKLAASISRAHNRLPARRQFHPNPPPNRSEWVMWVGNVPSDATHEEVWRFLKHSVTVSSGSEGSGGAEDSGVTSIFLISRSHCAFANYQSEEHLNRAISQFSGRKIRPHDRRCPRLVCRARRKEDDLRTGVGAQRGMGIHTYYVSNALQRNRETAGEETETTSSKGPRSKPSKISCIPPVPSASREEGSPKSDTVEETIPKVLTQSPGSYASTSSSFLARHFPKRFFILKSLTRYDLDLSVERGVWATQKHNEAILDQAFRTSREVILVFSVNRSGEFYGYAQMASGISRGNSSISWATRANSFPSTPSPSSGHVAAHGTSRRRESPLRQSPETYAFPTERQLIEASPSPFIPSSDETKGTLRAISPPQVKSAQARRSLPPTLDRNCEDPVSSDLPPGSSFSSCGQERPQASQNLGTRLTLRPESGKCPGVRAGTRSKGGGGTDDLGDLGLSLSVVGEAHSERGAEEDTVVLSAGVHRHLEAREREASWGEVFKIEWLCTKRVQFHRTRHLRNPWNHGREIKVSRDGTELEPGVGQQLVEAWSTLASEPAGSGDARCTGGLAGKCAKFPVSGPSTGLKDVEGEPSRIRNNGDKLKRNQV